MDAITCNNCGLRGHMYRDCRKPVLSYGHIICNISSDTPEILMIMRKDSLCYIEFLRGKYDIYNISYIQTLIDKCSLDEKKRLCEMSYDELWRQLWNLTDVDTSTMRFKGDYLRGKEKFTKLKEGYRYNKTNQEISLTYFINCSKTTYDTSEWEFPKGRRNNNESDKACAIREFEEETGYTENDYSLFKNVKPYSEEYLGENNVRYKHVYYLGYIHTPHKTPTIDPESIYQQTEIRDIQWLSREECLQKLRDYHHTRLKVVNTIFDFLHTFSKDYYIVNQYTNEKKKTRRDGT